MIPDLTNEPTDLGEAGDLDVVDKLVDVAGLKLLDVGCGDGKVARDLVERGAIVQGIEPDPIQAQLNREAPPMENLSFVEAGAQSLPLDDNTIDGVFFTKSLHHVPEPLMDDALREARRVLKPETGFLYVMEPLLTGTLEDVYRPFHNETKVRGLAYAALARSAVPFFEQAAEYCYHGSVAYLNFTEFVDQVTGRTFCEFSRHDVDTAKVRALFERGKQNDGYAFTRHLRVNLFRQPTP